MQFETMLQTSSPERDYFLGFFAADGNISINQRGAHYVSIQAKDKQIIEDMRSSLGITQKISERKNVRSNTSFYRIQIGSKTASLSLQRMGFSTRKTKHLPFPSISFVSDFIRGYFDGDGHVWFGMIHKHRKTAYPVLQLGLTSCSKDFLLQTKKVLAEIAGTAGSLIENKDGFYRLQYSTRDALKIYQFMYNSDARLMLFRKKSRFDEGIQSLRV